MKQAKVNFSYNPNVALVNGMLSFPNSGTTCNVDLKDIEEYCIWWELACSFPLLPIDEYKNDFCS